jgi:hypothetical protein
MTIQSRAPEFVSPTRNMRGCLRELGSWFLGPAVLLLTLVCLAGSAVAVPSFAIQTGQPCAICHVGAFGPALKPYGRDFKLRGYVASDGQENGLPIAAMAT